MSRSSSAARLRRLQSRLSLEPVPPALTRNESSQAMSFGSGWDCATQVLPE
jgi:hypothetical protein